MANATGMRIILWTNLRANAKHKMEKQAWWKKLKLCMKCSKIKQNFIRHSFPLNFHKIRCKFRRTELSESIPFHCARLNLMKIYDKLHNTAYEKNIKWDDELIISLSRWWRWGSFSEEKKYIKSSNHKKSIEECVSFWFFLSFWVSSDNPFTNGLSHFGFWYAKWLESKSNTPGIFLQKNRPTLWEEDANKK